MSGFSAIWNHAADVLGCMHFRRLTKATALVVGLCLYCDVCQAQQVILNTRGERIVVYPDGSWRYYEASDSVLLSKNLRKEDLPPGEESPSVTFGKATMNPATDSDISALSVRFAHRLEDETENVRKELALAVSDKFAIEGRLDQAQKNKKLIEPDFIAALEDAFEDARIAVKAQQKHLKKMEKLSVKAQGILTLPLERRSKKLSRLIAKYEAYLVKEDIQLSDKLHVIGDAKPLPAQAVPEPTISSTPPRKQADQPVAKSAADLEVYERKPVQCQTQVIQGAGNVPNGVAVVKGLLFTHTDEDLRPYFRQDELISCYASLRQIENNTYLNLEFVIASSDARKNFGILEQKSLLRLKLMNGMFVNLFNARVDQGRIDAYTGDTVYDGYYLLDRESERLLAKYELDKIRLVWSSGFEDYDVVDVDFLINQFACLATVLE